MKEATQQQQQTWGSEMSATVLSAFYDMDMLYKQDKNMNMNALHISSLLEQKAVGAPLSSPSSGGSFTPGFFRRNSSNTSSTSSSSSCSSNMEALTNGNKYPIGSYSSLKESSNSSCSTSTALMNKENKFRDRVTFGEGAERQLQAQQKPATASQINSTRYKTELCRPFEENGACKYGDKCQFAHGYHELRSLSRHPKYKTEPCRTFHTIGFCPYGPRCHFIHNAEERRPAPAPSAAAANANSGPVAVDAKSARELCGYGPREVVVLQQQQQQQLRPRLQHSLSFSGFSSHYGLDSPPLLHSPTSRTPPPPTSSSSCCTSASSCSFYEDTGLSSPGTLFPFPGQDLRALLAPLAVHSGSSSYTNNHSSAAAYYGHQGSVCPPSPPSYNISHLQALRGLNESPVLEPPPSPPDSLSDRESYASGSLSSSGSLSGSESPSLDAGRRLPIFSRLSISDD